MPLRESACNLGPVIPDNMTEVVLTLFGAPTAGGLPDAAALGSKPLALLAFLALEPGSHRREELAALLWSDAPDDAARASLRQALTRLRPLLGPALRADRQVVELASPIRSDAADFLAAADRSAAEAAGYDVPRFLGGFSVRGAGGFEEWAARTRHRLLQRYEAALREVAQDAVARCRWRDALGIAERWLETDPLSEEATGAAMQALYCLGDRGAALARYQELRARLAEEASATPLPWLADLARRIERAAPPPATGEDDTLGPCFDGDLVGREAHWTALTEAWTSAIGGRAGVVLLEGEAGIGKTRLAEELGRWVASRGGTWLRGQGYQAEGGGSFGAMAMALRGVLDAPGLAGAAPEWLSEASRLVPEIRSRFPGVPAPPPGGTTADRQQLFEGVAQVLLAVAAEGPMLLLVDDLHWCDAESCALLRFLVERLAAAPFLLVGTVTAGELARESPAARLRSSLAGHGRARRLALEPFTFTEVWELVRQLGNIRAPAGGERFARRLHEITGGNPFHVIELLKTLFSQGVIGVTPVSREWVVESRPEGDAAPLELPRSVREAIGHRVDRLPYELRDVLVTVAMARRPVTLDTLTQVHGMSRLRAAALGDALIERHLLRAEGGAYAVAHPTLGAVVRAGLSPVRTVELHRALALALAAAVRDGAQPDAAAEVAWHAARAGEVELARQHALLAASAARERLALDDARDWMAVAAQGDPAGLERADLDFRTVG